MARNAPLVRHRFVHVEKGFVVEPHRGAAAASDVGGDLAPRFVEKVAAHEHGRAFRRPRSGYGFARPRRGLDVSALALRISLRHRLKARHSVGNRVRVRRRAAAELVEPDALGLHRFALERELVAQRVDLDALGADVLQIRACARAPKLVELLGHAIPLSFMNTPIVQRKVYGVRNHAVQVKQRPDKAGQGSADGNRLLSLAIPVASPFFFATFSTGNSMHYFSMHSAWRHPFAFPLFARRFRIAGEGVPRRCPSARRPTVFAPKRGRRPSPPSSRSSGGSPKPIAYNRRKAGRCPHARNGIETHTIAGFDAREALRQRIAFACSSLNLPSAFRAIIEFARHGVELVILDQVSADAALEAVVARAHLALVVDIAARLAVDEVGEAGKHAAVRMYIDIAKRGLGHIPKRVRIAEIEIMRVNPHSFRNLAALFVANHRPPPRGQSAQPGA
nr:MAG TPA: hypothetical protein [Caudoviricetes sp.]